MIRRAILVGFLLVGASWFLASMSTSEPVPMRRSFADFPSRIGNWESDRQLDPGDQVLRVLGVSEYVNRVYRDPEGAAVGLYVGYYRSQRQGASIHSPLNCLPGAGWQPIAREALALTLGPTSGPGLDEPKFRSITINDMVIQKGPERQIVLYWYQGHGRIIASEYMVKIYSVLDAIRTNRTDGALVRIISPVVGQDEAALRRARDLAADLSRAVVPLLGHYLPD